MITDFNEISYRYHGNWVAAFLFAFFALVSVYALFVVLSQSINSDHSVLKPAIAFAFATGFTWFATNLVTKELGGERKLVLKSTEVSFPQSISNETELLVAYTSIYSVTEESDGEGGKLLTLHAQGFHQTVTSNGFRDSDVYESFKMNLEERVQAFRST